MSTWAIMRPTLHADRGLIENELQSILTLKGTGAVAGAMRYSVLGQGQRIRPLLALRIARFAGSEGEHTLRAAAAVELLHCASLIVDDLPCMDDERMRRDRPTTHVAYGEPTALLSAFGLVALAARCVVEQRCTPSELSSLIRFQIDLLKVLDVCGLIEGQDMDLKLHGADREKFRARCNELKTVPLFELAAEAGLLFAEPSCPTAGRVRRFAREYGVSFQMVDDYLDGEKDDFTEVLTQLDLTRSLLSESRPASAELEQLIDYLHARCLEKQGAANCRNW